MSKDVKKKKSEETVQDEVKNQETDAKKKEACNCESECKADESQNTCEADESDKAEAQDESTESSKKKDPKDAVIEELQDRVKRQMAEFDNFRKRTEKEKSTMFEMGASDIIKKLLPIVDNFDRGFKSVTDEELETPFAKGMDMVHKQLLKMLEDAKNSEKILEAKACVCDSSHNLIVDLAGIKGIIPREEGAIGIKDGSVRDIAVISRVNRPVCFVVTDITEAVSYTHLTLPTN